MKNYIINQDQLQFIANVFAAATFPNTTGQNIVSVFTVLDNLPEAPDKTEDASKEKKK